LEHSVHAWLKIGYEEQTISITVQERKKVQRTLNVSTAVQSAVMGQIPRSAERILVFPI